jgi:hypothetical protein
MESAAGELWGLVGGQLKGSQAERYFDHMIERCGAEVVLM